MIQTLILIIDDSKKKREIYYDLEHSNWHHLKILSKICKYAQTDTLGGKHYNKEITCKELIELITKNANGKETDFEKIKDFRGLNGLVKYTFDGYIIFHKQKGMMKEEYNDIWVNVGSCETGRADVQKALRLKLKELKRR